MCLSGLPSEHVLAYMDDLVIFTRDFETHCTVLQSVLRKLIEFKISVKKSKCMFAFGKIDFFGFNLSKDDIKPQAQLTESIRNFKGPEGKKELMRFLEMVNFYRNCAEICKPLNTLTRDNTPFEWKDECESAFCLLKNDEPSNNS